jgi:hypothetical protein
VRGFIVEDPGPVSYRIIPNSAMSSAMLEVSGYTG